MRVGIIVLTAVLSTALAAEESCEGRCDSGFSAAMKCQCDVMCGYFGSCCSDYDVTCRVKSRGDTFAEEDENVTTPVRMPQYLTTPAVTTTHTPTATPDPDAATCSGRRFNAFMQLKNGSTYAFRGDYFFELDEKSVMPGFPKLIKDVWGIAGPIDAAFTRINCQGKTYIFRGKQYWRFDGDVLDEDYPRDISVGFQNIPDNVDAAFAVPAPNHHGKEKVYFFKGDQYYQYEFKHQPSHEECAELTKASPSILFNHYADLYCEEWEKLLDMIFQDLQEHHHGPHFINRDWVGIKAPVDAAMAAQIYLSPAPTTAPTPPPVHTQKRSNKRRRRKNRRGKGKKGWRHWTLSDIFPSNDDYDYGYITMDNYKPEQKSLPVQYVYFFKEDKYYRVDLKTKRVDYVNPPYPRSIAKYWLGCKENPRAEKR